MELYGFCVYLSVHAVSTPTESRVPYETRGQRVANLEINDLHLKPNLQVNMNEIITIEPSGVNANGDHTYRVYLNTDEVIDVEVTDGTVFPTSLLNTEETKMVIDFHYNN